MFDVKATSEREREKEREGEREGERKGVLDLPSSLLGWL